MLQWLSWPKDLSRGFNKISHLSLKDDNLILGSDPCSKLSFTGWIYILYYVCATVNLKPTVILLGLLYCSVMLDNATQLGFLVTRKVIINKSNTIGHFWVPNTLPFKNDARCTTFLVKMSFISMRMKKDSHVKVWSTILVLKQRPGGTRKSDISLAGAPCDLYTQLLDSSQSVVAIDHSRAVYLGS